MTVAMIKLINKLFNKHKEPTFTPFSKKFVNITFPHILITISKNLFEGLKTAVVETESNTKKSAGFGMNLNDNNFSIDGVFSVNRCEIWAR